MSVNTQYNNYYNYNNASNAYTVQAKYASESVKATGSYLEITGDSYGSKYGAGTDGADISSQARELLERSRSLDVFSCIFPNNNVGSGQYKSLSTIQNEFMSDFSSFSSTFGSIAGMYGMGSGDSVTMGLDGKGGMTVGSNNSELASNIGSAMGIDKMTSQFALMAARAALVDAGSTVDGFQDQYDQDPVGAIEDNIDALKERLLGFRTVGSGGSMQYGFMRDADIEYSSTTADYTVSAA